MNTCKIRLPQVPKNDADVPAHSSQSESTTEIDNSALELPEDIYISMLALGREARQRSGHITHKYRDILLIPRGASFNYPRIESGASTASTCGGTTDSQESPSGSP
ncbi:hypothetical protein Pmar_PMAR023303 [Perkinsus marinus ATCC 50983]|uniref:Uncharacterized protein n=1 Tax=Perkinsus marinus (strain ATCC 50983 / TXsc) TaxID=423536 RepID=C5KK68_PERM5|nr:hypothetical protein Pmar_PMAR023303 [Perkinsus marinus ATCC 50983]EER14980.1 hypothetical protein Pmar_PMAR023303 [Perkinsus marinus ATCC 50983]|eukprot:XP_002783184.1 hypothetical protein Pmar_PMAR023303 [Perkinsus marinus ATCC 50983]